MSVNINISNTLLEDSSAKRNGEHVHGITVSALVLSLAVCVFFYKCKTKSTAPPTNIYDILYLI